MGRLPGYSEAAPAFALRGFEALQEVEEGQRRGTFLRGGGLIVIGDLNVVGCRLQVRAVGYRVHHSLRGPVFIVNLRSRHVAKVWFLWLAGSCCAGRVGGMEG